jgi:hypothetical protein
MTTYASIHGRRLRITGSQQEGWGPVPPGIADAAGRELSFNFSITDDGGAAFLLVCVSEDGQCHCDAWHKTLDEAFASAEGGFGIKRQDWTVL